MSAGLRVLEVSFFLLTSLLNCTNHFRDLIIDLRGDDGRRALTSSGAALLIFWIPLQLPLLLRGEPIWLNTAILCKHSVNEPISYIQWDHIPQQRLSKVSVVIKPMIRDVTSIGCVDGGGSAKIQCHWRCHFSVAVSFFPARRHSKSTVSSPCVRPAHFAHSGFASARSTSSACYVTTPPPFGNSLRRLGGDDSCTSSSRSCAASAATTPVRAAAGAGACRQRLR